MKYRYSAVDARGRQKHGSVEAASEQDAIVQLREQQLVPTRLAPAGKIAQAAAGDDGEPPRKWYDVEFMEKDIHLQKISRKKLIVSFTQLGVMLRAGVSLSLALDVMAQNEADRRMRKILHGLHTDLLAGVSLSQSMSTFACFDAVTINLVRAGEADGHLERSFDQIASVQEKQQALRSKLISASVYPILLVVMVAGVVTLLNTMVLPSFVEMFEAIGTGLPAITVAVMGFSKFCNHWGWLVVLIIVLLVLGYKTLRRSRRSFALKTDNFKLHLPLVGTLIRQSSVARFSRILSTMLESGQDFLSALNISRSVIANEYISDGLSHVADEVRVGNPISASMQKLWFFDPVYISMLRAGEESGSLSTTLGKMADMYEEETDATTKRLTTLMEPIMTILVSVIVGVVVVAIAMPMFGMFNLVGNV